MKPKPIPEGQLNDSVYQMPRWPKSFWVLLALIPFALGLLIHLPLKSSIEASLKKQAALMNCPIRYSSLDFEWFLPKLILNDLTVMGTCLNTPGKDLQFTKANINFRGPSILPPGPRFLLDAQSPIGDIHVYVTPSFTHDVMKIEETEINLAALTNQLGNIMLEGLMEVTGLIDLHRKEGLKSLDVLLKSKNLQISPQNIQGLLLPALPLKNFVAKATLGQKNKIQVREIIIGDKHSPIIAQFSGDIILNPQFPSSSALQLTGEMKFSPAFLQNFAIIKLFLNKYRQKNGMYQIKILGTLDQPMVMPL